MSKRIDQLTAASDAQVLDDTWLWAVGDPATGQLYKATRAQLTAAFGVPQKEKYVATGSEGTTLTPAALAGKTILSAAREGVIIYEVEDPDVPDSLEFTFDGTDVELGVAVSYAGERFVFVYV